MRTYDTVDELLQQAEYFIDTVSGYRSDFALFPEFFNAPLMAKNNHLSENWLNIHRRLFKNFQSFLSLIILISSQGVCRR